MVNKYYKILAVLGIAWRLWGLRSGSPWTCFFAFSAVYAVSSALIGSSGLWLEGSTGWPRYSRYQLSVADGNKNGESREEIRKLWREEMR